MVELAYSAGQRKRVIWFTAVLAVIATILLARLARWQLSGTTVRNPRPDRIPASRGNILDANGHYLVSSTVAYKVGVSPRLLSPSQKKKIAPKLAAILERSEQEIAGALAREDEYVVLGAGLPPDAERQLLELESDALVLEARYSRVYPDEQLAASVIGFVDYEDRPNYGLEQYYDGILRGTHGVWYGVRDAYGQQILILLSGYRPAKDGSDLKLTLDRNIQHEAERILRDGVTRNRATSGNLVVLEPTTGAVLAMANYPTYAPGTYWQVESPDQFVNTSISWLYEPGSVFKPLTLAAAMEARLIRADSEYDDRGEIIVGQQRILNSDRKAHGPTDMTELLAYSRNVGAAYVASLLGETRFYESIRRFGFGEITGVDLMLEERGIMRVPGDAAWHKSDLATNSYGQGISVTPLQVVAAFGALANKGVLMRPRMVGEIRDGPRLTLRKPVSVRRVVSVEVAEQISEIMADAVEMGMKKAAIPGYRIAGKSSTAGVPDQEGYRSENIIASFVGYGPLPDPRFVVLAKFDRPTEGSWGVEVAAPEFRTMARFLLDYYGIPPTESVAQAATQ